MHLPAGGRRETAIDAIDRKLLNRIQENLPITASPFAEVAAGLGIDEAEVRRALR